MRQIHAETLLTAVRNASTKQVLVLMTRDEVGAFVFDTPAGVVYAGVVSAAIFVAGELAGTATVTNLLTDATIGAVVDDGGRYSGRPNEF